MFIFLKKETKMKIKKKYIVLILGPTKI